MTLEQSASRFWSRVKICGESECWPWTGRVNWAGYGSFSAAGKEWRSNRLAWMFTRGPLERHEHVLHRCDNPSCCNPAHLFLGDPSVNAKDRDSKGRGVPPKRRVGEETTGAKLTASEVLEIRRRVASGELQKLVALDYCVNSKAICKIVNRQRWTHL